MVGRNMFDLAYAQFLNSTGNLGFTLAGGFGSNAAAISPGLAATLQATYGFSIPLTNQFFSNYTVVGSIQDPVMNLFPQSGNTIYIDPPNPLLQA